ncbi:MAG: VIT and VWA domain-containing protein [Chloracidobacterium sp.]|uniref:VWA domain-containing protein n=1 Tax=Chloracidobacterium validum TaxID=2821543 RepID=A0ABX8B5D5_9BACT|nr:VIT and VWA domain-containing protein [Chloracidobacterium validum]QUW02186.1 VWA domain-containing protein [Chloracidobacterium validum]
MSRQLRRPLLAWSLGWVVSAVWLAVGGLAYPAAAQSGVVLPGDESAPDPTRIALEDMRVDIRIDQQFARVRVVQIYANRTNQPLEGKYIFRLPTSGAIADFAVWDGDVRIPGVMLELPRAQEIYGELKRQAIDPGLVTQEDEAGGTTAFTVRLVPIPAFGTKRVELEYVEAVPVAGLRSFFSLPLKPSQYGVQSVGNLRIRVDVTSGFPLVAFKQRDTAYPCQVTPMGINRVLAEYQGAGVALTQDFAFDYGLDVSRTSVSLIAYRSPEPLLAYDLRDPNRTKPDEDGYFEVSALLNERGLPVSDAAPPPAPPRSVVLLLDTSLSMNFEKLDRAYEACGVFLKSLRPEDRFNLALFNDDVQVWAESPRPGTPSETAQALDFIRRGYLSGGTDLAKALQRGLALAKALPGDERALVIVTDGNPTLTTTRAGKLVRDFAEANAQGGPPVRVFAFGVGADANRDVLGELARVSRGVSEFGRETDDLTFRLDAFFAKVGQRPVEGIKLRLSDPDNAYAVYPNEDATGYDGSRVSFVGRYRRPVSQVECSISGARAGQPVAATATGTLPAQDTTHAHLPRLWAQERISALLRRMTLDGEDDALIAEVIALSKKYNIVTPYTAFLAAPRALLRPRVIKPGDPVLRVRADASIRSVVAVFPFGLTKPLTYLAADDVWETRFLAPKTMQDGRYRCRLILTDASGNVFQEEKGFTIDSRPPQLGVTTSPITARAGGEIEVRVAADADTRRITARLAGGLPILVKWDPQRKTNVGVLRLPPGLPAGRYVLLVTAEDFAHNVASREVPLDVLAN